MLQEFLDQKDQLVEWACQEHLEKKVCLESLVPRASLAYPGRKDPKGRKGRQADLALEFPDCLGKREIKGQQVSQEVLERREKKEAAGSQACPGLRAPKDHRAMLAIQEALGCLEKKVTKASRDWMAFLASKEKQVSLGRLARRAQRARKGNPAMMEFPGRRERRVNQVYPEEDSQGFQGPKERKVQRVTWVSQD